MSEFRTQTTYADETSGLRVYIANVFARMGLAVLITAAVAFLCFLSIANHGFMYSLISSEMLAFVFIVPALVQFGICLFLSTKLMTMQPTMASILLYVYAAVTGFTFSIYGILYDSGTFFTAFAFAAVMFFSCAVIGHTTNVDLTKFRGLMIGGLIAIIIASIASLFIPMLRESLLISYLGVIVFLFLTAWDMQKIKGYYYGTQGGMGTVGQNLAVFGAFQLYLDFINIFLYVLRIVGSRSRK